MTAAAPELRLAAGIDADALAIAFARDGRAQIEPFLDPPTAYFLAAHLSQRSDWKLVFNAGEKVYEAPRSGEAGLSLEQEARLRTAVDRDAVKGFGYCFDSIRVPDEDREEADPLHRLAALLSSREAVALFRRITRRPAIAFADAQATAYGAGDFLTAHDDEVAGKGRLAAYVLGLTPDWRTEWGGLLMFHDARGDVVHGFRPRMNALSLFAVPQVHSVSRVAAGVIARRQSVTGWLRART